MSVEVVEKKNCVPFYFLNDREAKFYFASAIVEGTFNYYNIGREVKLVGKPPWDLKNIIKLIHFGEMEKIDSSIILSEKAKSDSLYKKYCGGIEPSDRSIRDYRHIYSHINHFIMNFTLLLGEGLGLTNFNHISVDGTIKLAFNSPYNIIKRKDVRLLIRYYMVEELSKKNK